VVVNTNDRYFKCPACGEISTQNEWDNVTKELCVNRDERRKYVSIGINGRGRKWYKCPKCGKAEYNTVITEIKDVYPSGLYDAGGLEIS
jgi:predicted RNA-binding Zn-ribbon protein involved in translation (DUF1610 family)